MRAHPSKRAGQHPEVAPARVRGGDDTVVLHRYSAGGVTLSCPVKVRARFSEGAETGVIVDDARPCARRDSTAGPPNDRGARPGAHLPTLGRPGDLTERERRGVFAMPDGQMFWRRDSCTAGTRPSLFSLK